MATILPLGKTQFCDALGNPLAGGSVYFYIPNTTTPKDTWQDADQTVLNSNPVVLDSAGEAVIYGSGSYRQIVKDADGNLIWDQQTSEASSGQQSFGGTSTGTANAQVVSAGTFNATDGSVITFIAGLSNTGAMTLQVGSASAVAVYKNSGSGPVDLASGDIVSGNIYSVVYSVNLAVFQLLQSIPPTITIASETEAEAGTNNTNLMTPLRTNQAIQALTPAPTIATQAQAETGTDNTVYMTPLRSAEAISALGQAIGVGQTWQAVSRAAGTVYQNATGRPIQLRVTFNNGSGHHLYESTDAANWIEVGQSVSSAFNQCYPIIPNWHYYYATGNIVNWYELR